MKKQLFDKIFGHHISAIIIYALLIVCAIESVSILIKSVPPYLTPIWLIAIMYVIAIIVFLTFGAVVVRGIIISVAWIINSVIQLFKKK